MPHAQSKQLLAVLSELKNAVEDLLLAGLTAASQSTIQRLDVTFKEASRLKLLRLGGNLRIANEEISRFTAGSQQFSAQRLAFFLGRTWILANGMQRAIAEDDDALLDRLMLTPQAKPVKKLSVVTLGVSKRVVPGAFATFEFRMRAAEDAPDVKKGKPLIWSCVFPMRKDLDLPAEAFLHLPQKQKFRPSVLLDRKVIHIDRCLLTGDGGSAMRILLDDASEVTPGEGFTGWKSLWTWDAKAALARLGQHRPTPLDVDVELQEEVFLDKWQPGEKRSSDEGYDELPLESGGLIFEARLDRGVSGNPLHGTMLKLAKNKHRPPLFGVAHYESCKLAMQPLSVLGKNGVEYLTVSPDKISQAALVKAMKFT